MSSISTIARITRKSLRRTAYVAGLLVSLFLIMAFTLISAHAYETFGEVQGWISYACTAFVGIFLLSRCRKGFQSCTDKPFEPDEKAAVVIIFVFFPLMIGLIRWLTS